MTNNSKNEWEEIQSAIARLRASIMAVVFGMFGGASLFVATAWLLIKGGPNVGENLSLLRHYFPGYSVTWGGAFVGLFYGLLVGAILGFCLAFLYNLISTRRNSSGSGQ